MRCSEKGKYKKLPTSLTKTKLKVLRYTKRVRRHLKNRKMNNLNFTF